MMRETVLSTFEALYGYKPGYLVRAPGRANLIGEHTDYHNGYVMPLAVDRAVYIAMSPRFDDQFRLHSVNYSEDTTFTLQNLGDEGLPHWSKHVQGAWWLLRQAGIIPPGADMVIGGDIPIGAGMSSSAAIGVGCIEAGLALAGNNTFSQPDKAVMAVQIEHQFLGMPSGNMDQTASAAALSDSAMLLDCMTMAITPVPIPEGVRVVVINSNKRRLLTEGRYALRRQESESVAPVLGVSSLREADMSLLDAHRDALTEVQYRRGRHVITENGRVWQMKDALEAGDLARAGELINASHASLRDDYEVSIEELDTLTDLARQHPACYGARIMGGGFGGCAVSLVKAEEVEAFQAAITPPYAEQTGLTPEFYVCIPSPGSGVTALT